MHAVGGLVAVVGATMVGPRIGKYGKNGKVNHVAGHSLTLGSLGVFILWLGWFGFNAGSTLEASFAHISKIKYNKIRNQDR